MMEYVHKCTSSGQQVKLFSRNMTDITNAFPELADANE